VDEAEGFLLEHALISPPRTWPPLPTTQADRIAQGRKKMDWEGEVRDNPDDPTPIPHRGGEEGEENKERCVICLMALRDRTVVGVCGHEFCVCPLFLPFRLKPSSNWPLIRDNGS
jgi:E3 ubiquitin-protein ligase Topors